jgi:hypothetical protein
MTTVVVGGHSRKVGKTSVAAGIVGAFPQCRWTAVKITSHRHDEVLSTAIYEETDRSGHSDTSRFLAAGAARALWVRANEKGLDSVVRQLLPDIQSDPYVLIESNRILKYIQPDLIIFVLRYDVEEFKDSARETLCRADAVVAVNYGSSRPPWEFEVPAGVPIFPTINPPRIPGDLIRFLDSRFQIPDI